MNIFFENLPIYYINLDRRKDRLNHFIKQADILNLKNTFRIRAVDGNLINEKVEGLSNLQIACSMSHLIALNEFLNSKFEYAMICEDDVDLLNADKIDFNFCDLLNKIPPSIDCIQTSIVLRKEDIMPFKLKERSKFYFGTASYIVSKKYAEYLVSKYYKNSINLNVFKRFYVSDPRGGNMEINPVADQLVYESKNVLSLGIFTTVLNVPDISDTDEQAFQFIKSREDVVGHWGKYERITIDDIF